MSKSFAGTIGRIALMLSAKFFRSFDISRDSLAQQHRKPLEPVPLSTAATVLKRGTGQRRCFKAAAAATVNQAAQFPLGAALMVFDSVRTFGASLSKTNSIALKLTSVVYPVGFEEYRTWRVMNTCLSILLVV